MKGSSTMYATLELETVREDSPIWRSVARVVESPYGLLLAFLWGLAEALAGSSSPRWR